MVKVMIMTGSTAKEKVLTSSWTGDGDAQHQHADGDRIRGDDAQQLPFESDEQRQMAEDVANGVGETVLRKRDERGGLRHERQMPSIIGSVMGPLSLPL
jgi:hypothetical protein